MANRKIIRIRKKEESNIKEKPKFIKFSQLLKNKFKQQTTPKSNS